MASLSLPNYNTDNQDDDLKDLLEVSKKDNFKSFMSSSLEAETLVAKPSKPSSASNCHYITASSAV